GGAQVSDGVGLYPHSEAGPGEGRIHRCRQSVDQPAAAVDTVAADIHHGPTASHLRIEEPLGASAGTVVSSAVLMNQERSADLSILDRLLSGHLIWHKVLDVSHGQSNPGRFTCADHRIT